MSAQRISLLTTLANKTVEVISSSSMWKTVFVHETIRLCAFETERERNGNCVQIKETVKDGETASVWVKDIANISCERVTRITCEIIRKSFKLLIKTCSILLPNFTFLNETLAVFVWVKLCPLLVTNCITGPWWSSEKHFVCKWKAKILISKTHNPFKVHLV